MVPDEVLLEKGHRRIGFINNVDPMPAQAARLEGYKQALERYGVAFDASLVRYGTTTHTSGGYRCAMELMQLPEPPTALFCFNDLTAMDAYDELRNLGLAIPGDVAVIGFDTWSSLRRNYPRPSPQWSCPTTRWDSGPCGTCSNMPTSRGTQSRSSTR